MDKVIYVNIKSVYGQMKVYPACETSQFFADLAGNLTLTDLSIKLIKEQGYTIMQKMEFTVL